MNENLKIVIFSILSIFITIIIIALIPIIGYFCFKYKLYQILDEEFENFCMTAVPIIYKESVYPPLQNGIYEKALAQALIDISITTTKSNCDYLLPIPHPPGFTEYLRVEGIDPIDGKLRMFAYIYWTKNHQVVIAFTGTLTISEVLLDINYYQIAPTELNGYEEGILCHSGFYKIYQAIRETLWKWWNNKTFEVKYLYITGFSLGGALSTLCAFDFAEVGTPLIHYSFAAPRSGNVKYTEIFNQRVPTSIRVNNTEDIIPQMPLSMMGTSEDLTKYIYQHTGGNASFTISLPGGLSANHLDAYLDNLPEIL